LLFEQPMPVLADQSTTTSDSGRDYTNTLSGNAVSNALYIKPTIGFAPHQTLLAEFSYLGARTAVNPDPDAGRSTYGNELTLALHYAPFEHFTLSTHGAVFFPGSYYKNYASAEGITPAIASETFTATVWGGQITARVAF
jgi:hypothetical protein